MKLLPAAALAMLLAAPAFAQEAAPNLDVMQETIKLQQVQMTSYLNSAINAEAQLRVAGTKIAALQKQVADLQAKSADKPAEAPKEPAPPK